MLKSIEYSATFGSTGRTLAETIIFQKGFGTITGPNEAGKSFVIEMIRWCLFGSAALRGKSSELKKTKAKLVFESKGAVYTINRTPTNAKMLRGEDEIAVGTTPVNEKVVQVLGFGLPVFDMACVANQGEIEKLVAMKPTERKRLVDSVIGLGVIDDLAKIAGEEGNALKRQASDLADSTSEPVAPTLPEGFRPLDEVDADIAARSKANEEMQQLLGWLSHEPKAPVAPVDPMLPAAGDLEALAENLEELQRQRRKAMMELNTLPEPTPYSAEQLADMRKGWAEHARWERKLEIERKFQKPTHTLVELAQMLDQYADNDIHDNIAQTEQRIAQLKDQGVHHCPACSHEWHVAQEEIASLERVIDGMVKPEKVRVALSHREIEAEERRIKDWAEVEEELASLADATVSRPILSEAAIEQHEKRLPYQEQREKLRSDLAMLDAALVDQPDYSDQLRKRRAYDQALALFKDQMLEREAWLQEAAQKRAKAELLKAEVAMLPELQKLRTEIVVYQTLLERFQRDAERYTAVMEQVQELQEEAEDWGRARDALGSLRGLVKQHLMPSLNKVASYYLVQMTGGQRQSIFADEEFNILVDGQELNTLSGSGKAVACLALRLGLGQVLTNNILSLFIGDEIDASMDKERAENTAVTLQTLKNRLSQILLVTHKFPAADYYITVGHKHDQLSDAA